MRDFVIFQLFSVIKAVHTQALRCKPLFMSQHPSLHHCSISLYSNKTVYSCVKASNNKYILMIHVPRIDSYTAVLAKCKFKYLQFCTQDSTCISHLKHLIFDGQKCHLIKDYDNSSFCFSARTTTLLLFHKLLCKQLTNFCHKENNFKWCLHRFVIFSTFSDCIYQNHPGQHYSALVWENLLTQQRGYYALLENVRKIIYGFKALAKFLTDKTVVTRGTMVAFTNQSLIFRNLYCTSHSLSVLDICIKPRHLEIYSFEHTEMHVLFSD